MILVITANASKCRLYQLNKNKSELVFYKEIAHPENRLKSSELTADKSGHYKSPNGRKGAYSPHMDAKDIKIDDFSREIARELNNERNHHQYDHLIFIAPPHMTGLVQQHLDKHVKELIAKDIQKDLLHLSQHDLMAFLKDSVKFVADF